MVMLLLMTYMCCCINILDKERSWTICGEEEILLLKKLEELLLMRRVFLYCAASEFRRPGFGVGHIPIHDVASLNLSSSWSGAEEEGDTSRTMWTGLVRLRLIYR